MIKIFIYNHYNEIASMFGFYLIVSIMSNIVITIIIDYKHILLHLNWLFFYLSMGSVWVAKKTTFKRENN